MNFAAVARTIWRWVRWPLVVLVVLYVALVLYRIPAVIEKEKTAETIQFIQSQRLTMEHVDGTHLPPPPDPALADATIEGIDANGNGIRDDVELAIFEKYQNDIKVRAATLQYAKALQTLITRANNETTWVAATQEKGRGFGCIFDVSNGDNVYSDRIAEVEDLVFNTETRQEHSGSIERYRTSFTVLSGGDCDLSV